jgi:uncharacterized delta-60 repeat protein
MDRFWRATVALTAVCVCLAMAAVASAAKPTNTLGNAGLDKSFGHGGKTTVAVPKTEFGEPIEMATAPSGKSYVLDGSLLLAFGANGRPDLHFGHNGRVPVASATGATSSVADLTVDSQGRILVTGSFEPTPGTTAQGSESATGPTPTSEAFVVRYSPDGERDPSFGSGGQIDVTLETSPPPWMDATQRPAFYAQKIAVTAGDQPVLGGAYDYPAPCFQKAAFAAEPDTSTASGSVTVPVSAWTRVEGSMVAALEQAPGEGFALLSYDDGSHCFPGLAPLPSPTVLTAALAPSPGVDPSRPHLSLAPLLADDAKGRMLVIEESDGYGETRPHKLIRLLPSGDFDNSFGSDGGMTLPGFDEEPVRALLADSKGRALLGGGDDRFRVLRVGTKGKIDHSFARHGWAEASFPGSTSAELAALTTDEKGRIIAAGRVVDKSLKTGEGVALARFSPGK